MEYENVFRFQVSVVNVGVLMQICQGLRNLHTCLHLDLERLLWIWKVGRVQEQPEQVSFFAQFSHQVAPIILLIGADDLDDVRMLQKASWLDEDLLVRVRLDLVDRMLVIRLQLTYESIQACFLIRVVYFDGHGSTQVIALEDSCVRAFAQAILQLDHRSLVLVEFERETVELFGLRVFCQVIQIVGDRVDP